MENFKEQIAILNKNDLKEFNFLRDEVKHCGGMEFQDFLSKMLQMIMVNVSARFTLILQVVTL